MLSRLLRFLFISFSLITVFFIVMFFVITSESKLIDRKITAKDVSTAQKVLSESLQHVGKADKGIHLIFEQTHVDALANVASFTLPGSEFSGVLSPYGVALKGYIPLPIKHLNRSIEGACLLTPSAKGFGFDYCYVGALKLPQFIVQQLFTLLVHTALSAPSNKQVLDLFAKGEMRNNQLHFSDKDATAIKLNFQSNLYKPLIFGQDVIAPDLVFYLTELKKLQRLHKKEQRIAFYIHKLFSIAASRAKPHELEEQYKNALWALAVTFSNKRLAYFINPDVKAEHIPTMRPLLLNNRRDLALHFLYSSVLQMLGNSQLSQQIGTLKEIFDADGRSGFSFVDLAADRAGTHFAANLAFISQSALLRYSSENFERAIMPATSDLPEGLNERDMLLQFGGYNGAGFNVLEQEITARVLALSLYQH